MSNEWRGGGKRRYWRCQWLKISGAKNLLVKRIHEQVVAGKEISTKDGIRNGGENERKGKWLVGKCECALTNPPGGDGAAIGID